MVLQCKLASDNSIKRIAVVKASYDLGTHLSRIRQVVRQTACLLLSEGVRIDAAADAVSTFQDDYTRDFLLSMLRPPLAMSSKPLMGEKGKASMTLFGAFYRLLP